MTPNEVLSELSDYADLLREVFDDSAGERYLDLLAQAETILFDRGYWTGYGNSPITDKDEGFTEWVKDLRGDGYTDRYEAAEAFRGTD